MKLEFSRQIFEKYSNIKFHGNPFSETRVVQCRQTDVTKLTVAFRNFAKTPKKLIHQTVTTDAQNHCQILMVSDVPDAS